MAGRKIKNYGSEPKNPECYSYDWRHYLRLYPSTKGVSTECFEHVPFHKEWPHIGVKAYKIEVALKQDELPKYCEVQDERTVFWIANTLKFCGYMSKIIYDGTEHIPKANRDQMSTRWIHFVLEGKRVGYTTLHSLSIMPPKSMDETEKMENFDWRDYIFNKLVQKHSIPSVVTTNGELIPKYKSELTVGQMVEVLDKHCISQMCVGEVTKLVGGRVHVRYWDSPPKQVDFVCHEKSPTIFPLGWSQTVGHDLSAPDAYLCPTLKDSTINALISYDNMPKVRIVEGMRLEAVDPLCPSIISAATVKKVLEFGYMMVTIDGLISSSDKRRRAAFCYHVTSPLIFHCGYCQKRGIELIPPKDFKGDVSAFSWDKYLQQANCEPLPISGLRRDDSNNRGIKVGMKLEAVDIMEPHLICVATVSRVHGRLLKVGFDGWSSEYDQWVDVKSPDVYPMGWCEMNGYPLQHPPGIKSTAETTIIIGNEPSDATNGHAMEC